jgi:hypothetical protein
MDFLGNTERYPRIYVIEALSNPHTATGSLFEGSFDVVGGIIELSSYRDYSTSRIISSFVVGDCDDESKAQRKENLCS